MADLTREDQPRGSGIAGNDGLMGIGGSQKFFVTSFWKHTLNHRYFMG
jgi:hypothetical protein